MTLLRRCHRDPTSIASSGSGGPPCRDNNVMVLTAMVTHKTECSSNRNTVVFSFVALERLTEAAGEPSSSDVSSTLVMVSQWMPKGSNSLETGDWRLETDVLKSIETCLHQSCHPLKVSLHIPRELELMEADTVLRVQQSGHEVPYLPDCMTVRVLVNGGRVKVDRRFFPPPPWLPRVFLGSCR